MTTTKTTTTTKAMAKSMSMNRRGFLKGAVAVSAVGALGWTGTVGTATARAVGAANWMAGLGDGVALPSLTIPGTHDSGARHGGLWAECQTSTIPEQLTSGIRFLDIRCRAFEGSFTIHHGAFYQHLNFDDVLTACRDFLAAQPSETVLMRVKQEYSEVSDAEFGALFTDYLDGRGWRSLFRIQDGGAAGLPALGEARGKVVLLADNGGLPGGLRWGDPAVFDIQDAYMAEPFAKYPLIEDQFRQAAAEPGRQYVNFVSTAAALPPRWNAGTASTRRCTS